MTPRPDPNTPVSVPLLRPDVPPIDRVAAYYRLAEDANRYANFGPCHELLASRIADFIGRQAHCVPVANCTLGLMVTLRALTEHSSVDRRFVITPAYTFLATTHAISWCGFTPLFVDVDPDSWHMSSGALERAVEQRGERVAAVLTCSTFGAAPSMSERAAWEEICRLAATAADR